MTASRHRQTSRQRDRIFVLTMIANPEASSSALIGEGSSKLDASGLPGAGDPSSLPKETNGDRNGVGAGSGGEPALMADKKRIKIGLIGCGFYAQNHLHAWTDLAAEGADLVAVCDTDPEKAKAAAERFGAKPFTDAGQMFDTVPIDLVDITTQMASHRALAALAAEKGVAAVVQKPFAPSWEESIAIVETARAHNTWLAVHENFRFATTMRRVKAVIDSGAIGTPNWARHAFRTGYNVYRGQPYLAREKRLVILDVGIHVLDLARFFLGEVDRLSAETQRRNPAVDGEDTATILMRHAEPGSIAGNILRQRGVDHRLARRDDAGDDARHLFRGKDRQSAFALDKPSLAQIAGSRPACEPAHAGRVPRGPPGGHLRRGQSQNLCAGRGGI